jgi:hypothetical protein
VTSERAQINLFNGDADAIELYYFGTMLGSARLAREIVPTSGHESRAMMKRIENRFAFFRGQQLIQQRLKSAVDLEEVLPFDSLKVAQSSHLKPQLKS